MSADRYKADQLFFRSSIRIEHEIGCFQDDQIAGNTDFKGIDIDFQSFDPTIFELQFETQGFIIRSSIVTNIIGRITILDCSCENRRTREKTCTARGYKNRTVEIETFAKDNLEVANTNTDIIQLKDTANLDIGFRVRARSVVQGRIFTAEAYLGKTESETIRTDYESGNFVTVDRWIWIKSIDTSADFKSWEEYLSRFDAHEFLIFPGFYLRCKVLVTDTFGLLRFWLILDSNAFGLHTNHIGNFDFKRLNGKTEVARHFDANIAREQSKDIDTYIKCTENTNQLSGDTTILLLLALSRRAAGCTRLLVAAEGKRSAVNTNCNG